MIKDKIANLSIYKTLFRLNEVKENLLDSSPTDLKIIELEYETKPLESQQFENHKINIDVHVILEGEEIIGISSLDQLNPTTEYNENEDYQLYKGKNFDQVKLKEGEFLVLLPGEGHITGVCKEKCQKVKKLVYKVPF